MLLEGIALTNETKFNYTQRAFCFILRRMFLVICKLDC